MYTIPPRGTDSCVRVIIDSKSGPIFDLLAIKSMHYCFLYGSLNTLEQVARIRFR
jgi:hypothetical protein